MILYNTFSDKSTNLQWLQYHFLSEAKLVLESTGLYFRGESFEAKIRILISDDPIEVDKTRQATNSCTLCPVHPVSTIN